MKKITTLFLIFIFIVNAKAQHFTEIRNIESFQKIKIFGGFAVSIIKGENESVEIDSEGLELDRIITKVDKKGMLKIRRKVDVYNGIKSLDGDSFGRDGRVKLIITYKHLNEVRNEGSGLVVLETPVVSEVFTAKASGSGKLEIKELNIQNFFCSVSGSGYLKVTKGECKNQKLYVSGSGEIDVFGVQATHSINKVSGSGEIYVYTTQKLEAKVSGSGEIFYKGEPSELLSKVSGSGIIKRMQ